MDRDTIHEFFAAAIPGTERVLCDELRELGFASVRLNRGGIPFRGTWREGWRACLESRTAQRIQLLVTRFPAPSQDALYDGIRAVDWSPFVSENQTLSVSSVCVASSINHSGFAALKLKDAIVDQVREITGERPSVDRVDPDVKIFMHLANDKAAVYLDLAGEPLHRRGYRTLTGEAPLRETLAAAILRYSGWDRKTPLLDPMCGSGTIAIEAAMWSANIAPGLSRKQFGFQRWANFDDESKDELKVLCGELRRAATGSSAKITASDIDEDVLDCARANARAAGVKLSFKHMSVMDLRVSHSGSIVVTNPPYGVRLDKDPEFCRQTGAIFSRLHGWRVCMLAGDPEYRRVISAPPKFDMPISNGDLKCEFLVYDMK